MEVADRGYGDDMVVAWNRSGIRGRVRWWGPRVESYEAEGGVDGVESSFEGGVERIGESDTGRRCLD